MKKYQVLFIFFNGNELIHPQSEVFLINFTVKHKIIKQIVFFQFSISLEDQCNTSLSIDNKTSEISVSNKYQQTHSGTKLQ